jgi:hypothetical protein
MSIVLYVLVRVVPVIVAATIIWANVRMLRRARGTGYRYWLVNPRSLLAAVWGKELPICFGAILVGMLLISALIKLA